MQGITAWVNESDEAYSDEEHAPHTGRSAPRASPSKQMVAKPKVPTVDRVGFLTVKAPGQCSIDYNKYQCQHKYNT